MNKDKEKKKKGIGEILGNIVTGFFIVVLVLAVIGYKGIFGYRYLDILTSSMRPTMPEGTLVVIKETKASDLKVGDIITYLPSKATDYVTHRIKSINDNGTFITKGDANNTVDISPVSEKQIAGKVVFKIPASEFNIAYVQDLNLLATKFISITVYIENNRIVKK